jgi:uncharacterized protein DUF4214
MTKYRVALEGVRVAQQTWDHALNVDGWGDEIYAVCSVKVIQQPGTTLRDDTTRSKTMGDINGFNARVKVGTATTHGGIKSGDDIPYPQPWVRKSDVYGDRFPMVVFEGDLTSDRAVTLIPSIWEWDGGQDIFTSWGSLIAQNTGSIVAATLNIISAFKGKPDKTLGDFVKSNLDMGLQSLYTMLSGITGQAKDRPIGMTKQGDGYVFSGARAVVISSDVAEYILNSSVGFGNGVVSLLYQDDPAIGAANYQLFIRIEKLGPDIKPELWLQALYRDLLNRTADPGGLQSWVNFLSQGHSYSEVANGFVRSQEYAGITVDALYKQYLDRNPDPGGRTTYINFLTSGGASIQRMIISLCDSVEYKGKHPVPDAFVKSLYEKILGREPEPGAVKNNSIHTGRSTALVIGDFLLSQEYAIQRSEQYFQKFLKRSAQEPTTWAASITHGTALQDIIIGFVSSQEYIQRSQSG